MTPILAALVLSCSAFGAVDGDTLSGCGERVRLWGIDAVERGSPGYAEAGRALSGLVSGVQVDCFAAPNGQVRDRYRRLVALCKVGGKDVAEELVRGGYAVDYQVYSRGYYKQAESGR